MRGWYRWACLALLPVSLAASDADPLAPDFALRLPIHLSGANGVVQLSLPLAVYEASRQPELADLRVYNQAGEALPYHLDLPALQARSAEREQPATLFPSPRASADEGPQAAPAVELRLQADGSLHWRSEPAAAPEAGLAELIVDLGASAEEERLAGLRFQPPVGVEDYRATLRIDRSSDLRWWQTVAQAPLDWLQSTDGSRLANDRIALPSGAGRYLRIRWLAGEPRLFEAIHGRWLSSHQAQGEWLSLRLSPAAGRQPGDHLYRSSPAIAASQLQLLLPEPNLVLTASLGRYLPARSGALRSAPEAPSFQPWLRLTAWRMLVDGQERSSGPVQVGPLAAEQWVLRTDPTLPAPELQLQWRAQRLIFTARGQSFLLAVGAEAEPLRKLRGAALPLDRVAPGFTADELASLEQAKLGAPLSTSSAIPAALQAPRDSTDQRRWILWAVLALGVLVLAAISWQLFGQLNLSKERDGS